MQNGKKTFRCLTSLLLAALLALAPAAAGTASVASAAVNASDPKWGGILPLITEDNYATRVPDPEAPAPWGAVPDDAQLYYGEQELAGFIHFGVNTFTGAEWGTGRENPTVFNPTDMKTQEQADAVAEEWVQAFEDGGFKRIIFVAKHHDGFCLWPSAYTERDTASSSVPEVDVLLALSKACTKHDMDMGVYLSPWDESAASYGYRDANGKEITKEQEAALIASGKLDRLMDYNYYYDLQLREILGGGRYGNQVKYGNDGKFVEIWMDGAKGSGAYAQDYDFDMWYKTIHDLQPDALCYGNNASSGIHWVGNESGAADQTCWMKFDVTANGELIPTKGVHGATARAQGLANGKVWTVTECDVSIRSGWFHGTQHSMDELVQMYYHTAGYGAVWLLNVPPTTSGRFRAEDIAMLKELGSAVRETYATNFASARMGASATTTMGTERTSKTAGKFSANNVLNDDKDSYWTLQDGATSGQITIDLGRKRTFDLISLQEYIPLGQRIASTTVEYFDDSANAWKTFGETTTVGQRKLVLGDPVTSSKVRVTVANTTYCTGVPLLRSVGVYKAASVLSKQGLLPSGFTYMDDRAAAFSYTGSWSNLDSADGLGNTYKGSGAAGATVTGIFTGTKFYVAGIKGPACGQVEVAIDGEPAGVFEAHASERTIQQILYASPDLAPGEHTVKLTVKTGTYSDGSKTYFNFDGIYYANNENGILEFDRAEYAVREGGEVTVTITRTGGSKGEISFDVIDQPSTAVQGQHYDWSSANKSFTLADGETEASLTVKTYSASESAGAQFYLKIIGAAGGAVAGAQASACIQIKGENDAVVPNPQAPANDEGFTASHPFRLPEAERASAGLEYKYITAGSLPYYAAKAGTYTMTVGYSAAGSLSWSGANVEDGSGTLPSAGKTVDIPFTVSTAGAGTLAFTAAGGAEIEWIAFRLDSAKYIPATGITLNKNTAALYTNADRPDHTVKLTASLAPAGASGDLVWSSSDEAVATCDQKGLVTAVGNGTATITATLTNKDGSTLSAQAEITVQTKLTGVSITGKAFVGQELKAVTDPKGAAATYEWVRREKQDGTWTTIAGATGATYTVTADDLGANVFVRAAGSNGVLGSARSGGTALIKENYVAATGVTLAPTTVSLTVGESASLTATVAPEDASIKNVQWRSSDEEVATVSASGVVVAHKAGSATITVTTRDGEFTDDCTVTVSRAVAKLASLSLSAGTLKPDFDADTTTYTASVANDVESVTVTAAGADGATVAVTKGGSECAGGVVALAEGENEITVTVTKGSAIEDYTITITRASGTVTPPVDVAKLASLSLSAGTLKPDFDADTTTYTASVANDVESVTVTATGADGAAVAVTKGGAECANGVVALAAGEDTVVTVTVTNGTATKDYTITITRASVTQTVSKDALTDAIKAAEAAKTANDLQTKPAGTTADQVDKDVKFVTQDAVDTLNTAINAAQSVADDDDATQGEVDKAVNDLKAAVEAFDKAIETGTQQSSGGDIFIPTLPTTPNTTTTTTTNPDGSTTTTVTDRDTGTVTETTKKPDGAVETVETRKDGTRTETITDPEGGMAETVTAPNKDVTVTVTDPDGEVLAKVDIPAEIPAPETRFEDVPEGHWADEAIHNMAALEIVNGVGGSTFNRNGDMKRGDLALVLSRMSSATDKSYELTFDDVPATKYYANGVAWAAKTGVVTGRSAETFAPEATITREELAVMLYRYAKLLKLDAGASKDALDAFKDGGDTHGWAEEGMAWCVDKGILKGKGNGILDPRTNVTRAEVAVMLQRFMDLMK